MKQFVLCLSFFASYICYSQIPVGYSIWAKEFSKEIALFNAKEFLFKQVLQTSDKPLKFEVDPLAAASSGELTTLLYKCEEREKEGLVLGFYGTYWNDEGVIYTGFGFKHLDKEKATEFLDKIQQIIDTEQKYLRDNTGNNNIVFTYDDIDVLISFDLVTKIRLFWNSFDSTWERIAFERSHRRFERKKTK